VPPGCPGSGPCRQPAAPAGNEPGRRCRPPSRMRISRSPRASWASPRQQAGRRRPRFAHQRLGAAAAGHRSAGIACLRWSTHAGCWGRADLLCRLVLITAVSGVSCSLSTVNWIHMTVSPRCPSTVLKRLCAVGVHPVEPCTAWPERRRHSSRKPHMVGSSGNDWP